MMRLAAALLVLLLAACSTGTPRPKPADLQALTASLAVAQVWQIKLGAIDFPVQAQVSGSLVTLAAGDGTVVELDATSGRENWRLSLGSELAAGVGSDGNTAAVVTRGNELVALQKGKVLWRQRLAAQAFSAPLVAGGRIFLLSADRTVSAYDGASGRRLWLRQRAGDEPLVLRQAGVLLPVGDTLLVGIGGRLNGLDPQNGLSRWSVPIATPRGINDIERLVDLVGPAARQGKQVCARAFQAAVGCVDPERGVLQWSRPADGEVGLAADDRLLFGVEADGMVQAWRLADGERAWSHEQLRFRNLTAPLVVGRSVVVGDLQGFVHLLSRVDGKTLARLSTDGSAIATRPVLAGNTLVVVTRSGGVFGFAPQ